MQIIAIGQIVLSALKIDNGDYGQVGGHNHCLDQETILYVSQIAADMGVPEECTTGDNNGTWWCKMITDEDKSEKNVVVGKIVINAVLFILCVIGFAGVSYGNLVVINR